MEHQVFQVLKDMVNIHNIVVLIIFYVESFLTDGAPGLPGRPGRFFLSIASNMF